VLLYVFDQALRLLHPIVPFVTEALWQKLPGHVDGTWLATTSWPTERPSAAQRYSTGAEFELIRDIVDAIRRVRSEYNVPVSQTIGAFVVASPNAQRTLESEATLLMRLTKTGLTAVAHAPSGAAANVILAGGTELIVPLEGLIDVAKECARLRTELAALEKQLASLEARLENPGFVSRAPAQVVESERAKATEWRARRELLRTRIEGLCGVA
jgi:valyl-tRNA synthetase